MSKTVVGMITLYKLAILVAVAIFSYKAYAQDVKTFVPERAKLYLPIVKNEQQRFFPNISNPEYFGGLVEQESCIGLKHSKCWSPTSELKSAHEQGVGFGQITRAFRSDGSVRFDALTDMRNQNKELSELSWENVKTRPDLQIRTMIIMSRNNYKSLWSVKSEYERLKFTDAAYNGGLGGVNKERRLCGLKVNCDPQQWFNHVEKTCSKSLKPLYGNRNACMINREHVEYVFKLRMQKYKPYLQ